MFDMPAQSSLIRLLLPGWVGQIQPLTHTPAIPMPPMLPLIRSQSTPSPSVGDFPDIQKRDVNDEGGGRA